MSNSRLRLSLKQRLTISPLQIQQIKLIELTNLEMENRVIQEIEENPALEKATDDTPADTEDTPVDDLTQEEIILNDYPTEEDIPDGKIQEIYAASRNRTKEEIPYSEGESFRDYLISQLHLKKLTEIQYTAGEYLIGYIDEYGYIRREPNLISTDIACLSGIQISEKEIRTVLTTVIQEMDPPGIGAVNLQNCLLIQLRRKESTPLREKAIKMLENCFDEFSRKQYDKIIKTLDTDEQTLKEIIHEITQLNPSPGNAWESNMDTKMAHVTPDFTIENISGELVLNMPENIPDLKISEFYSDILDRYSRSKDISESERQEATAFIKEKLEAAQWFIDAVKQRSITLQKVMSVIISLQRDFFLSGDESDLKPMILKDVAQGSGYNISTVSRVSNSKYVQTQFGVFPLKHFFSAAALNHSGENITINEIKKAIKKTVVEENSSVPMTDGELTKALKDRGYKIARRTVAKYRKELGLPVSRLRKEL